MSRMLGGNAQQMGGRRNKGISPTLEGTATEANAQAGSSFFTEFTLLQGASLPCGAARHSSRTGQLSNGTQRQ